MEKKATIQDFWNQSVTGTTILIGGLTVYISATLGKKLGDFVVKSMIKGYNDIISKEVEKQHEVIKTSIIELKGKVDVMEDDLKAMKLKQHGIIEKNEGVLMVAMHTLEDIRKEIK